MAGFPAIVTDTSFLCNPPNHLATDPPRTLDYDCMARATLGVCGGLLQIARDKADDGRTAAFEHGMAPIPGCRKVEPILTGVAGRVAAVADRSAATIEVAESCRYSADMRFF